MAVAGHLRRSKVGDSADGPLGPLSAWVVFQVHCISTEFTPRKHGGEKGVPFRIQVDTFKQNENGEYTDHLHSASCQIKVFKVSHRNKAFSYWSPVLLGSCPSSAQWMKSSALFSSLKVRIGNKKPTERRWRRERLMRRKSISRPMTPPSLQR